jgi:hypothetical protein
MDNRNITAVSLDPVTINESLQAFKSGVRSKAILRSTRFKFKPKLRVFVLDINQTYIEVLRENRQQRKETIFLKDIHAIITDSKLVANGNLKRFFSSRGGGPYTALSFCLDYGSSHQTIDIVCKDQKQYNQWLISLRYLLRDANVHYEADLIKM